MSRPSRVVLFGDQTVDPYSLLKQLFRQSADSPTLQVFFRQTYVAVRREIAEFQSSDRATFPSFDSILSLAESYSQNENNDEAISTVLLCIAQLGLLLSWAEDDESIFTAKTWPRTYAVGMCTGMLPAAAFGASTSTAEFLKLAPELVCLSLRLGVEARRRSAQIESSHESWATLVRGLTSQSLQLAIDRFHESYIIPESKKAYISADANSAATISGPPSTLALLFSSSESFKEARKVKLPITAAFHAPHLGKPDTRSITGSFFRRNEVHLRKDVAIISSSSGRPMTSDNLSEVLEQIVLDVLSKPLRWSEVVRNLIVELGQEEISVMSAGPVRATDSLLRDFNGASIKVVESVEIQPFRALPASNRSGDIAIVGMAARIPGAETLEEIWSVLEEGKDMHKKIPNDRFDTDTHCDPSGKIKNTTLTPYGCFVDRPGYFDARLFNMSPREAAQTDPQQRLLLLTTYEALEMAGYNLNGTSSTDSERIGTFFGQTLDDYRGANASQNIEMYYVTGGIRAFGPGRLNYHFKWEGPSYCVDAACSSSALSIQMAVSSLRSHECDTAVAGGTNILTGSDMYSGLSRGSFLSPTGSCKTFDNDADGYCRGDGVGSVVLKRLEDAIAEGDNIQAVIKSAVTNHSAHAISITHPHAETQQKLMRRALREASLEPGQIDYVEMHGTGTQAGDATEFSSVTSVLANRPKDNPLHVGAVKANIGHAEAAAGTNSLMKILMMMRKNTIPPHVGIKGRINEKFPPLDKVNVRIDRELSPFNARPGSDGKRRILLNNFNATGGNTSLIIEDPPQRVIEANDPRKTHVVATSAKTPNSFKMNMQRLLDYVESHPKIRLEDLSYSTTARKMHHNFRKSYAVENLDQLTQHMKRDLGSAADSKATHETTSAVFMFTGQGAQYLGMGGTLYETSATFKKSILDLDSACVRQGLPSIEWIVAAGASETREPTPTESQLALISIELALASLWKSWGVTPVAVIGHSLGEYAAMCVAGVLSVSDTLYLVGKRAEQMEKKCIPNSHAMLAVQSGPELVKHMLSTGEIPSCEIACFNGPASTVVSGNLKDVNLLRDKLETDGVKHTLLKLPYAFHSVQMEPILNDILSLAQHVEFCKPTIAIASTLLGSIVRDQGVVNGDYLARQARQSVKFQDALKACRSDGIAKDDTLWIEMGPHPLCGGMVRSTLSTGPTKTLATLRRDEDCWATISKSVANAFNAGINVNWAEYHRDFQSALRLLELPTYAFDLKNYWLQYEGNWAITKADAKSIAPAPKSTAPAFSTTCLQHIDSETFTKDSASVNFSSQLGEANLNTAVRGHLVNGLGLCPSSVYADVAFTAAWYIASRMAPSEKVPAMDLSTMEVFRPLMVNSKETTQILKVKASRRSNEQTVKIEISSQDEKGTQDHAHCSVMYGDGQQWMDEWNRNAYLVESRMEQLFNPPKADKIHKLLKPMVYKQFKTVVDYSPEYHNIDDLVMDCDLNETAANIRFQPAGSGHFKYPPYWIDTVAHLAGFILNASVNTPADTVFISHGWQSFRVAAPLSEGKQYRGYVRMQPVSNRGVMAGDVYILDGDNVVVVCQGLKFQQMKRKVLQALLGGSSEPQHAKPSVAIEKTPLRAVKKPKFVVDVTPPSDSGEFSKVLEIIASEVGVDVSDFADDSKISDLGVDSLLTITILGRLRTETGLDLPSSLFISCPTVNELKVFFSDKLQAPDSSVDEDDDSDSASRITGYTRSSMQSTAASTPPSEPDVVAILLSTVASEVGIDVSEISPTTQFSEIGVDSLLTISILDAFKTQMRMDLPANFFQEHTTAADVQKALGASPSAPTSSDPPMALSKMSAGGLKQPTLRSKSVLLQGRPSPNKPSLFLLPDGAGSLFSYISMPALPSGVAVYGLDSPFHNDPKDYTISFEEVASIYIKEIRSIQPRGPYMLGGWSLGGIHAYETSRQLIAQGETVNNLIMIDSPCPGTLPPLPSPTLNLLEKAGVFDGLSSSGGPITERTRLHFLGSVRALEHYKVKALPPSQSPGKVTVIWAQDGVLEGRDATGSDAAIIAEASGDINADMDKAKQWLTGKRVSFGPSGWDKLTGTEVRCHVVGGNHFSIMFPPKITAVAAAVASGLPV